MEKQFHIPVLGRTVVERLLTSAAGTFIDGTIGGGGHAELFLEQLSDQGMYIGIDRDSEAIAFAKKRLKRYKNISFYHGIFSEIDLALKKFDIDKVDGILLDLGVSSHQIDEDRRGFAFRPGVNLDMRMDEHENITAANVLNRFSENDLIKIFREYGEERHSARIARLICTQRVKGEIRKSDQLLEIINRCVPARFALKSYARIFQALRIEVNDELNILKTALEQSLLYLKPGGRIGVIAYHSLEDRIVKQFFNREENPCVCPPELPLCVCGKRPRMKRIRPYLIKPDTAETVENPRSRSAKLRIGERL